MGKKIDDIRHGDYPEYKEQVMSQLFGEFIGFIKAKGLTQDLEFATQIQEIFQCSRKVLWIDRLSQKLQIVVDMNSIHMTCEFGVAKLKNGKPTGEVVHRNKIENLRYKISSGTNFELTDGSQERFNAFFEDFKKHFAVLEAEVNLKNKKEAVDKSKNNGI
jgi:hypothetical protein